MVRQVILDTETTGLDPRDGHRIIEIGGIEMVGRRMTDSHWHRYLNPDRDSDEGALKVHGLTRDFLADKPRFEDVVQDFLDFIADAEVIIHNAPFDVGFLDAELARLGRPGLAEHCASITDSLRMAREMHPGKRNSLDVLCERYGISNQHRVLHGALLDAGLLAEVYLAMTRGQDSLEMALSDTTTTVSSERVAADRLIVLRASAEEIAAHEGLLDGLEKQNKAPPVWRGT